MIKTNEQMSNNLPKCFEKFKNTRAVLDCTEVSVQKPNCLKCRLRMYSYYKGKETIKIMIAVSPGGQIIFISPVFGGRTSDKAIFNASGIMNKLIPGTDALMVDKVFEIEEECLLNHIKLFVPLKLGRKKQFSYQDFLLTKHIAAARVHVERVIQRIKIFKVCQNQIHWSIIPYIEDIFNVICGLVNLGPPVLSEKKFL